MGLSTLQALCQVLIYCPCFPSVTGLTSSFAIAVMFTTVAMFAKSFHNFGSCISPLDIAPKHAGVVHGIVNSAGSFAGKLIFDI